MADAIDPNAAPMHHDVRERFAAIHVVIAGVLGITATVAGIVFGVIFVNN